MSCVAYLADVRLGGGDLDGDGEGHIPLLTVDYTLIWDQRFVQPLIECAPMDYTAPTPIRVENVTQKDLNEVRRGVIS